MQLSQPDLLRAWNPNENKPCSILWIPQFLNLLIFSPFFLSGSDSALALNWNYIFYFLDLGVYTRSPYLWLLILLNNFLTYTQPYDTFHSKLSLTWWWFFVLAFWDPLPVPGLVGTQGNLMWIHMSKALDVNHGSYFCFIVIYFFLKIQMFVGRTYKKKGKITCNSTTQDKHC